MCIVFLSFHGKTSVAENKIALKRIIAGMPPNGTWSASDEYPADTRPWFIGVQYHPELKSRPFEPHPLFASFIAAAKEQSRLV